MWTNWGGNVRCEPKRVVRVASEAEIVEALAPARAERAVVRVAGAGHSFSPLVATDGTLIDCRAMSGIARLDVERRQAWVHAGTRLHDLGEPLLAKGLAMQNLGDIDTQLVGGALATGTHGTGRTLPNLSAQVSGLRILRANGSLEVIRRERDPETLQAARVSLGALGIVTAACLELVPAYRLHERTSREPIEEVLEAIPETTEAHRHFEFFWLPEKDIAECKRIDPTDDPGPTTEPYQRIDWSSRILPSVREERFLEMEYALPAEAAVECFRELRRCVQRHHPDVVWPVEFRTLRSDDAWLSPAHDRETVTLSVHQGAGQPYESLFRDAEALFVASGGRPHWGKFHSLGAEELAGHYACFEDFRQLRAAWDPDGLFVNAHLRALLHV